MNLFLALPTFMTSPAGIVIVSVLIVGLVGLGLYYLYKLCKEEDAKYAELRKNIESTQISFEYFNPVFTKNTIFSFPVLPEAPSIKDTVLPQRPLGNQEWDETGTKEQFFSA